MWCHTFNASNQDAWGAVYLSVLEKPDLHGDLYDSLDYNG